MFVFNRRHLASLLFVVCALLVVGWTHGRVSHSSSPVGGAVIYVDHAAIGNSDGSTWEHAYPSLQSALTAATSGDEIWVAQGIYKPTSSTDQTISFAMKSGVAIYGGFAATETLRTERDWEANITVLSGDIDNNDITDPNGVVTDTVNIVGNNSRRVVISDGTTNTAILDGFTITAGFSSSTSGGGLSNNGGSPTLGNLVFSSNRAFYGGGLYNSGGGQISLENVHFRNNLAGRYGGGIYNTSEMHLTNVSFTENYINNDPSASGGGLYNTGNATLINSNFKGNSSHRGGAIYNGLDANIHLTNAVFVGNLANPYAYGGGGLYNYFGNATLVNTSFSGNYAHFRGGGIHNYHGSIIVRNSIFWNNQDGTGVGTQQASFYNNGAQANTSHSLVQGCNPNGVWVSSCGTNDGNNLADVNPLFTDTPNPSNTSSTTGDLRLQINSPAINTGHAAYLPPNVTVDLDGNPRIHGLGLDLGAYEFSFTCPTGDIVYVAQGATGANNGTTWADAFTDLQTPLNLVTGTCEIWVAQGVYKPTSTADRTISFAMKSGVAIYGGFAATETLRTERDWETNITVLSGDIGNNDITDTTGVVTDTANIVGDNSYHVVVSSGVDETAILDGFTITAGLANIHPSPIVGGGGVYNSNGTPVLTNIIIIGNQAYAGGGIYNSSGAPTLTNIILANNKANYTNFDYGGGGLYNYFGNPILTNVEFRNNFSSSSGGGLYTHSGNLVLTNGKFFDNDAGRTGGGIYSDRTRYTLVNVDFTNNNAQWGGGLLMGSSFEDISSLTDIRFINNHATQGGGGVANWWGEHTLTNVIFVGNTSDNLGGAFYNSGSPTLNQVTFSGNKANGEGGAFYNEGQQILPTPYFVPNANGYEVEESNASIVIPSPQSTPTPSNSVANVDPRSYQTETVIHSYTPTPSPTVITPSQPTSAEGQILPSNGIQASNPIFQNVIFWNNEDNSGVGTAASSMVNANGANPISRYSLIQGCNPAGAWVASCGTDDGGNLADADPLFVEPPDPANAPTTTGNLRLLPNSPAIDAGNNSYLPPTVTTDLDGNPRIIGTAVDLGAYESNSYLIHPNLIGQGAITLLPDTPTYTWGTVITATASPHPGWSFAHWSGDLSGTANPITFTVQGHTTLTATFANDSPTAEAGPNQTVLTNASVTLDGSGSADGDPEQTLSYGWVQTGGTPVALSDSTAVSPTFTAPASRTVLTFTLTVTDSLGTPSTADEVVITVQEPGLAIHFHATPTTAEIGQTITYTLVITNMGDVLLSGLSVTDTLAADFDPPPTLALGDSISLVATYTVLADDLPGPLTHQVWVSASAVEEPLTAEASAVVVLIAPPPAVYYLIYLPLVKK